MLSKILSALFAAVASAHLCTLDPLQRGGVYGAGTAGADICFQVCAGTVVWSRLLRGCPQYRQVAMCWPALQ